MRKTIIGIFSTRSDAEKFINHAHNALNVPNEQISYIYKDVEGRKREVNASEVASSTAKEGAAKGAKAGAVIGALGGIAAVAGIIPVIGPLFAAGPLLTALGITGAVGTAAAGAVTGAAVGGLIGALANLGVGQEKARLYEDRVNAGDILVAVNSENNVAVEQAMEASGALEVATYQVNV